MKRIITYLGAFVIVFQCLALDFVILSAPSMWPARVSRYWALASDMHIRISGADFSMDGLVLRDVTIFDPLDNSTMISAPRIVLRPTIFGSMPHVIEITQPEISLVKEDNSWNIEGLIRPGKKEIPESVSASYTPIHVKVVRGNLSVADLDTRASQHIRNIDVEVYLTWWGDVRFDASLATKFFDAFSVKGTGTLDPLDLAMQISLKGASPGAFLAGEVPLLSLNRDLAAAVERLKDKVTLLKGTIDVEAEVKIAKDAFPEVNGTLDLSDLSLLYAYAPGELSGITGTIGFKGRRFEIRNLDARFLDTALNISGGGSFAGADNISIVIRGKDIPLGWKLLDALPPSVATTVKAFKPEGFASGAFSLIKPPGKNEYLSWKLVAEFDGRMDSTCKYFPFKVENVHGSFYVDPQKFKITKPLKSSVDGLEVEVTGNIDLKSKELYFQILASNLPLDTKLLSALKTDSAKVFRIFSPEGKIDVRTVVTRPPGEGKDTSVDINVAFDGSASVKPAFFPYRIENISGRMRVTGEKTVLTDIRSTTGRALVYITAPGDPGNRTVVYKGKDVDVPLEVDVYIENLPIDYRLRGAMPPSGKKVYDALNPTGRLDCRANFVLLKDGSRKYTIHAHVSDVTCTPEQFPYTFDNVSGNIILTPGCVLVKDFRGGSDGLTVCASGEVVGEGNDSEICVRVELKDLLVNEKVLRALRARGSEVEALVRKLTPSGMVDAKVTITKTRTALEPEVYLEVMPKGAEMVISHEGFRYRLGDIFGLITMVEGDGRIVTATAKRGSTSFRAWGTFKASDNGSSVDIRFTGKSIPLSHVRKMLSASKHAAARALFDKFAPDGLLNLKASLKRGIGPDEPFVTRAVAEVECGSFTYERFPIHVSSISGRFGLSPDGMTIERLSGRALDGTFTLENGTIAADGSKLSIDFEYKDLLVDKEAAKLFPQALRRIIEPLNLVGRFSGYGRIEFTASDPPVVYVDVVVEPSNTSLKTGVKLAEIAGKVHIRCHVVDFCDVFLEKASLDLRNFKISRVRVAWGCGEFILRDHFCGIPLGYRVLGLRKSVGNFYDGAISGFITVHAPGELYYGGAFRADGSNLSLMARTLSDKAKASGSLDVYVGFFGNASELSSLRGEGFVFVRHADVVAVPFFNQLSQVVGSSGSYFDKIFGEFKLRGPALAFKPLFFKSSTMNLAGEGIVDFEGQTDFVLGVYLGGQTIGWIPGFSDLWETIWDALYKVRVTGHMLKPSVAHIPLGIVVESPYKAFWAGRRLTPTEAAEAKEEVEVDELYDGEVEPWYPDNRFAPGY